MHEQLIGILYYTILCSGCSSIHEGDPQAERVGKSMQAYSDVVELESTCGRVKKTDFVFS
jgi:hypothetical protein